MDSNSMTEGHLLGLAFFTQHDSLESHPGYGIYQLFIPFYF